MSRLVKEKGIENIIPIIPLINELGGSIIFVGKGETQYEEQLTKLAENKEIIFIKSKFSPF